MLTFICIISSLTHVVFIQASDKTIHYICRDIKSILMYNNNWGFGGETWIKHFPILPSPARASHAWYSRTNNCNDLFFWQFSFLCIIHLHNWGDTNNRCVNILTKYHWFDLPWRSCPTFIKHTSLKITSKVHNLKATNVAFVIITTESHNLKMGWLSKCKVKNLIF